MFTAQYHWLFIKDDRRMKLMMELLTLLKCCRFTFSVRKNPPHVTRQSFLYIRVKRARALPAVLGKETQVHIQVVHIPKAFHNLMELPIRLHTYRS